MKIQPMATNRILLEMDSGVIFDINENTIRRTASIIKIRLADSMNTQMFDWVTTSEYQEVNIEIERR